MIEKNNNKNLKIEGKKVFLTLFTEKNLNDPRYLNWLRDYDVVKTIYREEYLKPIPFEEVKKYVNVLWDRNDCIFLAMYSKEDNSFIGTMKINNIDKKIKQADIGILIGEKSKWGKGYATDAIAAVSKYCFEKLKLRKVTAGTMSNNIGMNKVFEKLGYKQEGCIRDKLIFEGKYYDHLLFGCFLDEFNYK